MRRLLLPIAFVMLAHPIAADTVVLANGKRLENVVVSRNDAQFVVVNPWNSRLPDMTYGIPAESMIERAKVKEVIVCDPPREEYLRRATGPNLTAKGHFELAERCRELGLKSERAHELEQALRLDANYAEALDAFGGEAAWREWTSRRPELRRDVVSLERDFVSAKDADSAAAKLAELQKLAIPGLLPRLERARRSQQLPKGLSEARPLTIGSESLPGASYCIFVPKSYDPLQPTPLVVGLHGGGPGGLDRTLVTGSGEMAMPIYSEFGERSGFLVVCPTALTAPWPDPSNESLLHALLREIGLLYNIDRTRIYLTGHSLGGYGTWHFAAKLDDVWAACAPCSGGGEAPPVERAGVPIYIYHGADDPVAPVEMDRTAARALLAARRKKVPVDFAYTELDGQGHGLPDRVTEEIFRWFSGRARAGKHGETLGPDSSFDAKVSKEEIEAFGDPEHPFAPRAEPSVAAWISELKRGGGRGRKATEALAAHRDETTATQVASILRDAKTSREARLLAVRVLGDVAQPFCVALVAPAVEDRDFRVVDGAVAALAAAGGADAATLLARASPRLSRFFADSFFQNNIVHVEYNVRLKSFENFVRACERVGQKDVLLPCIERDVVVPVFTPKTPYVTPDDHDPMFEHEAANARLSLAKALRSCLVAYRDPRGLSLSRRIRERWSAEPDLASELDQTIASLGG